MGRDDDLDDLLSELDGVPAPRSPEISAAQHRAPVVPVSQAGMRTQAAMLAAPLSTGNLDELLEEIEGKRENASLRRAAPSAFSSTSSLTSPFSSTASLRPEAKSHAGSASVQSRSAAPPLARSEPRPAKCSPPLLGDAANHQACDQLRCSACDFAVRSFDDRAWGANVDYLFLRNNFPDTLDAGFVRKPGGRAYACQCKSVSLGRGEEKQVPKDPNLRAWFCGGTH